MSGGSVLGGGDSSDGTSLLAELKYEWTDTLLQSGFRRSIEKAGSLSVDGAKPPFHELNGLDRPIKHVVPIHFEEQQYSWGRRGTILP